MTLQTKQKKPLGKRSRRRKNSDSSEDSSFESFEESSDDEEDEEYNVESEFEEDAESKADCLNYDKIKKQLVKVEGLKDITQNTVQIKIDKDSTFP